MVTHMYKMMTICGPEKNQTLMKLISTILVRTGKTSTQKENSFVYLHFNDPVSYPYLNQNIL